ncbi:MULTISPECIES: small ribosomal subunit biogenesis GTPase RsgA [Photobacterium]|uniref:Small ribosomal subunit biogenesis GTPase RsgA n=1 Tax=Photobacterium piscicola TaxID=1378299 RepID=A0A1T5I3Q1_9GAMM|nr:MULTISPECIES: small ribosomal subunit biogenesis GTPase RsgA [Photobacterium]MEC6825375.1 small ribosomal subunit biogenesis GTPase RsgA [Photobacterium piscicola]MEC6884077.1 small ribosomal subunit biogenesis GTPase RsgA [Photobacterium piscicola]MEC6900437.1 small ribosomal subunit biogenesis GTPase RsgA [Photobacterium piscicola]MEC6909339.1 small ribosomal subunit biogenesis GTPase RsgA [Photobacterium piscicola]PST85649.1 small ribosomal subunit biogenesis GTPase RsgA [Photobacterium 
MAKKKKLTQGQSRRVRSNQNKRLDRAKNEVQWDEALLENAREGLVITRFGQHADVEDPQTGIIHRCNLRRSIQSLVSGDRVVWRPGVEALQGIAGVVEAVHERKSMLTRPDYYDGVKAVAANVDRIVIVSSILPELSLNIIDRYIIAAETIGIKPLIVVNKVDLLTPEQRVDVERKLTQYQNIGYSVRLVSTDTGEGLDDLKVDLQDHVSIFAGQSGVGKSSMVNALMPEVEADIGDVSTNSGLGQHTTTAARLYHFADGGDLIDSPGVREFGLWHLEPEQITEAFVEFRQYLGGCKFRDCKHGNDPGCIIREAVERGDISRDRYNSYHKIIESMSENVANRQFSRNKPN